MHKKLKSFVLQSMRVWKVLRRPSKGEYWTISKVSAIGLLILGLAGFIIAVVMKFFI